MAVYFHFLQKVKLDNRTSLKSFIESIFLYYGRSIGNINFIFCSDDYLLEINQSALKHNYYTDIITFDLSGAPSLVDADIFISVDRVNENSLDFGVSKKQELHRVMFHGVLHLCGFRDKSKRDNFNMRAAETKWLDAYF